MRLVSTDIIEKAGENGYEFYRIPGIIATDKGTLIVYYEARHGDDWAVIDIFMKRAIAAVKELALAKIDLTGAAGKAD